MIEERYCSYEVARLLKEKGFDEACTCLYYNGDLEFVNDNAYEHVMRNSSIANKDFITAPTHQMACDWIYENYGLYVQIFLYVTLSTNKKDNSIIKKIRWTFDIVTKFPEKGPYQYYESVREEFDSQYEATEAGLKYILNKI